MGLRQTPIRAAGGACCPESQGGKEVLLVHRPAYDDWSLPKGKAHDGESDEDCARREVEEETGLRCELDASFRRPATATARGRPKVVRYWAMQPDAGEACAQAEVDEVAWLSPEEAKRRLTWKRDRAVLDAV